MRVPCAFIVAVCAAFRLFAQTVPTGAPIIEYLAGNKSIQLRAGDSFKILDVPFQIWGPDKFLLDRSEDGQYFTESLFKDGKFLVQLFKKGNVVMNDIPYDHAFCGSRRLICWSEDEIYSIGLPSLRKEWSRRLDGMISMIDVDENHGLISICRSGDWSVMIVQENGDTVGELGLPYEPVAAVLSSRGDIVTLEGDFNYPYSLNFFGSSTGDWVSRESLGDKHCLRTEDVIIDRGTRSRILFGGYCTSEEILCFDLKTNTLAMREKKDTYIPSLGYWEDNVIATRCNFFEIEVMDNSLKVLKTVQFREVPGDAPVEAMYFSNIVWTPQGVVLWLSPTQGCK